MVFTPKIMLLSILKVSYKISQKFLVSSGTFGCVHLPPAREIQGRQAIAVGHGHIGPGLQERPADVKPARGYPHPPVSH